jgi:hypothetical protein
MYAKKIARENKCASYATYEIHLEIVKARNFKNTKEGPESSG